MYSSHTSVVTGLIGIGGVVVGVFLERFMRILGRVAVRPYDWHFQVVNAGDAQHIPVNPNGNEFIFLAFRIDIHNSKDVYVGFRDIKVVFEGPSGQLFTTRLREGYSRSGDVETTTVNVAPKQWIQLSFHVEIYPRDFGAMQTSEKAYMEWRDAKDHLHRHLLTRKLFSE